MRPVAQEREVRWYGPDGGTVVASVNSPDECRKIGVIRNRIHYPSKIRTIGQPLGISLLFTSTGIVSHLMAAHLGSRLLKLGALRVDFLFISPRLTKRGAHMLS